MKTIIALLLLGFAFTAHSQTLVYSCTDSGADGRILESDTIGWPNCQTADYRAPSKSLVVATNGGAHPFYWRLASKVTSDRIWTQTGTVGDWLAVNAIDWGTTTPVPPGGASPCGGVIEATKICLSWIAPTQNTDGTALTNLKSFQVHSGTSANTLSLMTTITDKTKTTFLITGVSPGTYFYGLKAVNSADVLSAMSNVVSVKKVADPTPDCSTKPKPADKTQSQTCPSGTTGSWQKVATYSAVAYPTCWLLGPYLPVTAPAGACVSIPVEPPSGLRTVGGDVFEPSPDYNAAIVAGVPSKFSWKLGSKVGTIKANVLCTSTYRVGVTAFYRVPATLVTWTGAKKTYVVASCKL